MTALTRWPPGSGEAGACPLPETSRVRGFSLLRSPDASVLRHRRISRRGCGAGRGDSCWARVPPPRARPRAPALPASPRPLCFLLECTAGLTSVRLFVYSVCGCFCPSAGCQAAVQGWRRPARRATLSREGQLSCCQTRGLTVLEAS